ncbi:MAG: imidazole glycerol phosphate synthase subunit HisH [Clostridia bacterium]|nr:imidazole glycerol phosphate synthase subunit HisH [Clostridia bacterium]
MTVIVDYGVGNLFSLLCSFHAVGENAVVSSDAEEILKAERIVLPGVGAFSDAALKLSKSGLDRAVVTAAKNKVPLLGICLGMQLLFDESYEYGVHKGLGLIRGKVTAIDDMGGRLKIPHIGWNALKIKDSPLFKYIKDGDHVYFVHSFAATGCFKSVIATTEYGATITAAVGENNVYGCQFHPEKSGEVGLKILKAFSELKKEK